MRSSRLIPAGGYRTWLLLGLTLLFVLAVRVRLREMPLERDEGEYAYAGQLLLQGIPPYKELFNAQLPGPYAVYALIMALFGQTATGIHLGVTLVNLATIILTFFLGRRLLDEAAGVAAAASYALLSLSPSVFGLAGHATHFVVLFAIAGFLVLLRWMEAIKRAPLDRRRFWEWRLFGAGLLFGLAFLMKQHGIFFCLLAVLFLLWTRLGQFFEALAEVPRGRGHFRKRRSRRNGGRERGLRPSSESSAGLAALNTIPPALSLPRISAELAALTLGIALPYAATCLLLWSAGAYHQFTFWTITYAAKYTSAVSLVDVPELLKALGIAVGANVVLWIMPWLSGVLIWSDERLDTKRRVFLVALLAFSFASASVGFYFRGHYFILALPAMALLIGMTVSRGMRLMRRNRSLDVMLAAPVLLVFGAGLVTALLGNASFWFGATPAEASKSTYGTTLFVEAVNVAAELKRITPKEARIAVIGSEPEIYFYAHRRAATGHIYMYPLMENQPYAQKMQGEMMAEVERARPEAAVFVKDNFSWLAGPETEKRVIDWWQGYAATNLNVLSIVKIEDVVGDADAQRNAAETEKHMIVYQRKLR